MHRALQGESKKARANLNGGEVDEEPCLSFFEKLSRFCNSKFFFFCVRLEMNSVYHWLVWYVKEVICSLL